MIVAGINFSFRVPVYVGALVVALITAVSLWTSNNVRRQAFYRARIERGLFDTNAECLPPAVEACRALLASDAGASDAKLYLATLLLREKSNASALREAGALGEEVGQAAAATAQHKAWGFVIAAVATYLSAENSEQGLAASRAEKLLEKALAADAGNPDVLANLALVQLLKSGPNGADLAQRWCDQALAKGAGSPRVELGLQSLHGWLLSRQKNLAGAAAAFSRAHALRPDRDDIAANRRLLQMNAVVLPSLEANVRRELLRKLESQISQFGPLQVTARNALGRGWALLKDDPKYLTGPFASAMQQFKSGMNVAPGDPQSYFSAAALLEERIAELARTLEVRVTGLNGETEVSGIWTAKAALSPKDISTLSAISKLLSDEIQIWQNCQQKVSEVEKVGIARLRELACVRRSLWASRPEDQVGRKALRERAQVLCEALLKTTPVRGEFLFARGQVMLEQGDLAGALREFRAAEAAKFQSPALGQLITALDKAPQIFDFRPTQARRWFGELPLVNAKIKSLAPLSTLKPKLSIDGQAVTALCIGAQIFYLPENAALLDGSHSIKVELGELEFPAYSFGVDRKPPTIRVNPDGSKVLGTKPQWTVEITDDSGLDMSSIVVAVKYLGAAPNAISKEIIRDGKYRLSLAELNIKLGALVQIPFKIGLDQEVRPGECTLTISASDLEGNTCSEPRKYMVK